jgi:hypothetical protein
MDELKAVFERIAAQNDLEVRFCFFIDGLDEYNGAEEDIVEVLKFLSASEAIKVCASTRPRSVYQKFFSNSSRTFDIAKFTKDDMRRHVRLRLSENANFRRLETTEFACEDLMERIAELAHGVWLWVFLITRDLEQAVNRDEGVAMLWKIVDQFPPDLKAYFQRIIQSVRPQYLEEMSEIFLITVDELQPLPLYAFSLLEQQRLDNSFAVKTPVQPLFEEHLLDQYPRWKSLIQNRCSDLLVVSEERYVSIDSWARLQMHWKSDLGIYLPYRALTSHWLTIHVILDTQCSSVTQSISCIERFVTFYRITITSS